jgi:hypothetical protein
MIKYLEGRTADSDPVGSLSYETQISADDINRFLFNGRRGDPDHFFQQIPDIVSRANIGRAWFVAVPINKQRHGLGRKLFRELTNRLIAEGATLGLLEVDPFLQWCDSDTRYASEIEWRAKMYAQEGWLPLKNMPGNSEVERIFMYADLTTISLRPIIDLTFVEVDEATHLAHQAESDREDIDSE